MQYLVVSEWSSTSYGAHVRDLPGCVAVGESQAEVEVLIREAIEIHIEGLREHGQAIPEPTSTSQLVTIDAQLGMQPTAADAQRQRSTWLSPLSTKL